MVGDLLRVAGRPIWCPMNAPTLAPTFAPWPFDNSYARLPDRFHARLDPTPVAAPRLVKLNVALAEELGLDPALLASAEGVAMLAGNAVPPGAAPLAAAYAGHQFGNFTPRLGDGRAILLGEVLRADGARRDIQLKGSGRTPFSRGGDGRAALGPVLREYIVSEAMAALGVPTTRALAAVATGEWVFREDALPGAVLVRVAASHIRVGSFQYFAARGDGEAVRLLADHVIARHYPDAAMADNPYRALLEGVVARQAALVARWMLVGFIHGVMNTDNTAVGGETIDYGPCAFLDGYDPDAVFSSIDHAGRYAYGNQPRIAQWNLTRLAETLLPLLAEQEDAAIESATAVLKGFGPIFQTAYLGGLARKIGIAAMRDGDGELAQDLLVLMGEAQADFTNSFRALCAAEADVAGLRAHFADPTPLDAWLERWRTRLAEEASTPAERSTAMRRENPAFIPRNHRVEAAIAAAVQREDFAPFEELVAVLATPWDDQPGFAHYADPPLPEERVVATFCGT